MRAVATVTTTALCLPASAVLAGCGTAAGDDRSVGDLLDEAICRSGRTTPASRAISGCG